MAGQTHMPSSPFFVQLYTLLTCMHDIDQNISLQHLLFCWLICEHGSFVAGITMANTIVSTIMSAQVWQGLRLILCAPGAKSASSQRVHSCHHCCQVLRRQQELFMQLRIHHNWLRTWRLRSGRLLLQHRA